MGFGDVLRKFTGADYEVEGDGEAGGGFVDDSPAMSGSRYNDDFSFGAAPKTGGSGKVLSIAATTHLQVMVFKPKSYNEVAEIAEHFKSKKTIVLNLEQTNKETSNRILDFMGGVAFAVDGHLKRIANTTYMIVPFNVEISGDTMEELESTTDLF